MKFILDKFPDEKNFQPDVDWIPLKEPTNMWVIQLQAIPLMTINIFVVIFLMRLIGISFDYNFTNMFISFLIFSPIHELIHALFFPENLLSENVFFGFTLNGFVPFAAYIGEMKRNTFIKVLLAPFFIISLFCLIYLSIYGSNNLIEHIIVFNALGACADSLGVFLILRQVPKKAIVRNKEIRTYWRKN